MTLAHAARSWVRSHVGVDVQRYPQSDPLHGLSLLLRHLAIDLVIDVGANDGGYARSLRRLGYRGRILSFEPLSDPFARLSAAARTDTRWEVVRSAVGDDEGEIVVHVAGNDGASSSVLPMLDAHVAAAPAAAYVSEETVPLHRLDGLVADRADGRRCFLKLDVQGYEQQVLAGAGEVLDRFEAIELELSVTALYEGQPDVAEMLPLLAELGFRPVSLEPILLDEEGLLMELDGLFARARPTAGRDRTGAPPAP